MDRRKKQERISSKLDEILVNSNLSPEDKEYIRNRIERDPLTQVYNKGKFAEDIKAEINKAKEENSDISLLMIDIDYFKKFNDTNGHLEGDKALKRVARSLVKEYILEYLRDDDLVYRYGGEEFVVLLPEVDAATASKIAERLSDSVNIESKNTVSIGVSSYKRSRNSNFEGDLVDKLIRSADKALYKAKNNGRNRVVVYRDSKFYDLKAKVLSL